MRQVAGFLVAALLRLQIERDSGVVGCPTDGKEECQCRLGVVAFVYIITEDHSTSLFTLTEGPGIWETHKYTPFFSWIQN